MTDLETGARQIEESRGRQPEGERLHALLRIHWQYTLDEYPELATYTGDAGRNHRWTDHSLEAYDRRNREMEIPARVLATIDRAKLGAADQVHYDLFRRNAHESLEGRRFKGEYMPVTQMGGVQQSVAQYLMLMPYFQRSHFEDAIARLEAVPALVDQTIGLLDKGLETGHHAAARHAPRRAGPGPQPARGRRAGQPDAASVPVVPGLDRCVRPGDAARRRRCAPTRERWRPPTAGSSSTWRSALHPAARARRSRRATCPTARPGTRSPYDR